jgi:hypothetical protein
VFGHCPMLISLHLEHPFHLYRSMIGWKVGKVPSVIFFDGLNFLHVRKMDPGPFSLIDFGV